MVVYMCNGGGRWIRIEGEDYYSLLGLYVIDVVGDISKVINKCCSKY